MTNTLIAVILAYLIGSIPFAMVVSWIMRLPDPRTYGSNNPGATNVLRSGSKIAALHVRGPGIARAIGARVGEAHDPAHHHSERN